MTLTQWFIFLLVIQLIHFAGTWKLYIKAGRKAWEAAVPVYNAIVLMKIINRPQWWVILLFIPIVNLIMFPVIWVETLRSFGKNKPADTVLGVVTLGLYIYYINYTQDVTHISDRSTKPKSESGETVSSILFAIIVATIIHAYFIQPFTIPTSSLEKTLLVGDWLFVSKVNYGARTPKTPIALPMVHDTIPLAKIKSYTSFPQLPYFRFPGFEKPEHNDIVVFNWPTDTVPYFGYNGPLRYDKPLDKKSNYVKRLVGLPGDNLSIKDGVVHINNQALDLGDRAKIQYKYTLYSNKGIDYNFFRELGYTEHTVSYLTSLNDRQLDAIRRYVFYLDKLDDNSNNIIITTYGIPEDIIRSYGIRLQLVNPRTMDINLTTQEVESLKNQNSFDSIVKYTLRNEGTRIFPHNQPTWTGDNLGPIHIPAKGEVVDLTLENLPFYEMVITDYEHNTLEIKGNQIYINGELTTQYTIQQDYYYMMGDNRHNSEDSRYWGFVPHDHIVGKPVLIWMSLDQNVPWSKAFDKFRWDRMFTTVHGSGQPRSYFIYVVGAIAAWIVYGFVQRRKKKKSAYKA